MLKKHEYLNKIIQGDALEVLKELPSEIIDCCTTSPPYYSLRFYPGTNKVWDGDPNCDHDWKYYTRTSNCWGVPGKGAYGVKGEYNKAWIREHQQAFCKKCGAWWGQLGLEPHPQMYIDHLVQIFREVKRVLKKTGVFFLNVGDTYWGGLQGFGTIKGHWRSKVNKEEKYVSQYFMPPTGNKNLRSNWLQPKQKLMIPSRVAMALQEDGWILRNTIIWYKPNHMPHPVKDRFTVTYEPVYMFVKSTKYYFDLDSVRLPHKWASKDKRSLIGRVPHKTGKSVSGQTGCKVVGYHKLGKNPGDVFKAWGAGKHGLYRGKAVKDYEEHGAQNASDLKRRIIESYLKDPKGKNPGDFWTIKTASFKGAHFAVFPEKLVETCLKAGCPKEVCSKCGKPKERKYEVIERKWNEIPEEEQQYFRKTLGLTKEGKIVYRPKDSEEDRKMRERLVKAALSQKKFLGYLPTCKCNEGFEPGLVLDPFIGSGTTALVAKALGLNFIGIELNKEYVKMANLRLKQSIVNYLEV